MLIVGRSSDRHTRPTHDSMNSEPCGTAGVAEGWTLCHPPVAHARRHFSERATRGRSGSPLNGHRPPFQNRTVPRTPDRSARPGPICMWRGSRRLAPRVRHPVFGRDHRRQVHQVVCHVVCEEVGFLFRHGRVRAGRETFDQGAAHPSLNGDPTFLFGTRWPSEDAHGDTLVTPATCGFTESLPRLGRASEQVPRG